MLALTGEVLKLNQSGVGLGQRVVEPDPAEGAGVHGGVVGDGEARGVGGVRWSAEFHVLGISVIG